MVKQKSANSLQLLRKTPMASNISAPARNLRKSDLGAVIFGCKHDTIQECLAKQIFGLPITHFSYVRNIDEGLPLFLFNYSDRKMHGIYEAAGHGKLNADSYAWTDGGKERTPFPAQVMIHIRKQCWSLAENQFKKVIEDNYYTPSHFWFELDHEQTRALTALFTPSPSPPSIRCPPVAWQGSNLFRGLSASKGMAAGNPEDVNMKEWKLKKDTKSSIELINENRFASLGWSDEDKENHQSGAPEDADCTDPVSDWEDLAEDNVQADHGDASCRLVEKNSGILEHQLGDRSSQFDMERVLLKLKKLSAERQRIKSSSNVCVKDDAVPCSTREVHKGSGQVSGYLYSKDRVNDYLAPYAPREVHESNKQISEEKNLTEKAYTSNVSDSISGNEELVQVIKNMKERIAIMEQNQAGNDLEIVRLTNLVKETGKKILQLKDHIQELESKVDPFVPVDDSLNKFVEQFLGSEDMIYLIGGFNGMSLLSTMDSFSPSLDILTPLSSMSSAKSYTSAVALDGRIYVIGGGDGSSWYNTVECYDRRHDKWTLCPSLIREKGSTAGVTLNGKIYVIGGGNGKDCFSEVEMFDPALGRWINSQRMLQKRFALAGAELNGAIYAVGGFDGKKYLSSAERLDPRQPYWMKLPRMNTRRGCHSLAVLNEKLYSVGGYDTKLLSTIDVYDPRMGSWVMSEPMNFSRGYAAGIVLGGSLFVIGGVTEGDGIASIVEYYEEERGWVKTGLKSIGKRCCCSAIAL